MGAPSMFRGIRRLSMSTSRFTAAVAPEPTNTTASSALALTQRATIWRASSRKWVVWSPVAEASVCVLAYSGMTSSRMKSSMKPRLRPDAV